MSVYSSPELPVKSSDETGEPNLISPGTFDRHETLDIPTMSSSTAYSTALGYDGATMTYEQDDSALFEQLMARHQERLYRVAYRMTGDYDEAQDLLQDALIEAFRAFPNFRKGTYFDKWLYRIMSRTFLDRKRSQRRHITVSLDEHIFSGGADGGSGFEREIADVDANPALMLDKSTMDQRLQDALEKLSSDYRLVLILSDIEEFSYEEISAFLECPIGTVRSRLHRARAQMRQYLERVGYAA